MGKALAISIHALLAESDKCSLGNPRRKPYFYPRSPCGERLVRVCEFVWGVSISIHALLAESDCATSITPAPSRNFYPRSPCGERHGIFMAFCADCLFLSTLSLRRATPISARPQVLTAISIHALLAESDLGVNAAMVRAVNFYPRSPCGERHWTINIQRPAAKFLSTLSLRRATAKVHKTVGHFCAYETNFMGIASSC